VSAGTARRGSVVLGSRWFKNARGPLRRLRWQRVLAVAIAVYVAIIGVTLWQANDDRADRALAQEPHPAGGHQVQFRVRQVDAPYDGDVWSTVFVATEGSSPPAPPGMPRFPAPGEVWVSPAVARLAQDGAPAAIRLPGPVTGVINGAGLQSPDQFFVVVGASHAEAGWWQADGWGGLAQSSARPTVPRWPMLALVVVLVGLPVLVLARASARMATEARERDLAALHLLGVARRTLATAAAVDAAWCALLGGVVGGLLGILSTGAVHGTRVLGFAWYEAGWPRELLVVLAAVVLVVVLVWWDVRRLALRALADPWGARAGRPQAWHWWRPVPLALGLALLVGVVLPYLAVGTHYGSLLTSSYFFAGTALGLTGGVTGLAPLMGWWSGRFGGPSASVSGFLGARRLRWERERIATACAGLLLTCVSGAVAAGALNDLAGLSPDRAGGDRWSVAVGGLDDPEAAAALGVQGGLRYLQVDEGNSTTNVADCRTLTAVLALDDATTSEQFSQQCRDGGTQRVSQAGVGGPGDIVIPTTDHSGIGDTSVVTVPVDQYDGPLRHAELMVYPGHGTARLDTYLDRLLAVAPHAQVTDTQADSYQPMVAPTERLLVVCALLGLLVGAALLALVSLGSLHRTRVQTARIAVLGGSRRIAAAAHTMAFAHGAVVTVAVGLTVGVLAGTTYTIAGGVVTGLGDLGWVVALLAIGVAATSVAATWLIARYVGMGTLTEVIQRE
jgi:hypothetical protein